ncbi:hypothetical protein [Acinetobacter phage Ab69]|nr:hypothetical protein [Acinetobacter phage Ab69]
MISDSNSGFSINRHLQLLCLWFFRQQFVDC